MGFNIHSLDRPVNLIDLWAEYCAKNDLTLEMLAPMKGRLMPLDEAAKEDLLGSSLFILKKAGALGAFVYPLGDGAYQGRVLYNPTFIPSPTETVDQHKYWSRKGAVNFCYVPPHLTDWEEASAGYDLILVEGALNAAYLASKGYHAVAVQGVENWRIGGKKTPMIPALRRLIEKESVGCVMSALDSDTASPENNPRLYVALHGLLSELARLRVLRMDSIKIVSIPTKDDGTKLGPNDYLVKYGVDKFNGLLRTASTYIDEPFLKATRGALERFIFDKSNGRYFDTEQRLHVTPEHCDLILANAYGRVLDISSQRPRLGPFTHKHLQLATGLRVTKGARFRPDIDDICFEKGGELYVNKHDPEKVPTPIKGDISLYRKMLASLCRDSPSAVNKIEIIVAWHAQNPGRTPKYAIMLPGNPRCGKSNMAALIGRALGRFHSSRVTFGKQFNSTWRGYACKEWPEFDKAMDEEWLKDLVTGKYYEVIEKYGKEYDEENFTLNVFTCNGLQAKVQEGDQRFVIGGYGKSDDKVLGLEFEAWVNGPGPAIFRYHLLNNVDCSAYDFMDVRTEMQASVIEASTSYKSTVKDFILSDLEQIEGLEILPNEYLSNLLSKHNVNIISFLKENSVYFSKCAKENVKIDGSLYRFRAFDNQAAWAKEQDTDKYRHQFALARAILKQSKF